MDDSNKKEFASLMYGLGEYYDKNISTNLLLIYFDDLKSKSIEEVKEAASKHRVDTKHGTFFPKSADIIRHFRNDAVLLEDKAALAWNQIIREMRRVGSYGSLKLDDKQAIASIKAVKSWKDLCAMPEKDLTWVKKEFMANYKTYENTPLELLPSSLPGLEELHEHKSADKEAYANITDGINKFRLNNKSL